MYAAALLSAALTVSATAPTSHAVARPATSGRVGLRKDHALLYVANESGSVVQIYDLDDHDRLVQQILNGVSFPTSVAVGSDGSLYVADDNPNVINVYPFGATSPTRTLSDGGAHERPQGVAVAPDGTVYVTGLGSTSDLEIYPPGATSPSAEIVSDLLKTPGQNVLDAAGNLYFADNVAGVGELVKGSTQPIPLNLRGITKPQGVAFDERLHRLYVSTIGGGNEFLTAYTIGNAEPLYQTPCVDADGIAFGGRTFQFILVPDTAGHDIQLFKPTGTEPVRTLAATPNNQSVAYKPPNVP